MFSLGCFGVGATPPFLQIFPPISVSQAAAPRIRIMAYKADLCSIVIIITIQSYTCKYTAINCTIRTRRIGAGFVTSALDSTPLLQNSGENTDVF